MTIRIFVPYVAVNIVFISQNLLSTDGRFRGIKAVRSLLDSADGLQSSGVWKITLLK